MVHCRQVAPPSQWNNSADESADYLLTERTSPSANTCKKSIKGHRRRRRRGGGGGGGGGVAGGGGFCAEWKEGDGGDDDDGRDEPEMEEPSTFSINDGPYPFPTSMQYCGYRSTMDHLPPLISRCSLLAINSETSEWPLDGTGGHVNNAIN